MAIGEVLPAIAVILAIYFGIRWFMGPSSPINPDGSITGVTPAMVETIHSAFPDVPVKNIVYNLSKTRSAQATSEEILERGYLPSAPNDFVVPPSLLPPDSTPATPTPASSVPGPAPKSSSAKQSGQSLIDRYGLTSRVPVADKGKGKEAGQAGEEEKGKWESSKEARERGLRERKEKMILEARRRMMEKQQQQQQGAT